MTDQDLKILCAFQEANLETDDGVAAIAWVINTRTRLRYNSNGTVQDTILRHEQFSWAENAMVDGRYKSVAFGLQQELARAQKLLLEDEAAAARWARCARIVAAVDAGTYRGPLYDQLTPSTVLYANLSICTPSWLPQARRKVQIDHQTFFEPIGLHAAPPPASAAQASDAAFGGTHG